MIARLLRDKGVVEFVEAAKMVRERVPAARFQLIGAADAENRTAISLGADASSGSDRTGSSISGRWMTCGRTLQLRIASSFRPIARARRGR